MNKLNPRKKICLKNNENICTNLNIEKFNKKKWNILKKNILTNKILKKKNKPEEKKQLFKERLIAKQQFKFFYGCISEYQIKNIFKILKKKKINIFQEFIILLESRLDIVIFRMKIAKSIFHAKQLINHGKIKINNKIIYSQNYILKKGDIISLNNLNININRNNNVNYLEFNQILKTGIFLRKPYFKEIEYPFFFNLNLIDEYFKKN